MSSCQNNQGMTALHTADNANAARALLRAGADINALDDDGNTPLWYVIRREKHEALNAIGADGGRTSPHHAAGSLVGYLERCDGATLNGISVQDIRHSQHRDAIYNAIIGLLKAESREPDEAVGRILDAIREAFGG